MASGATDPAHPRTSRSPAAPSSRRRRPRVTAADTGSLQVSICDAHGRPRRVPGLASWLASVAPVRARGEVTVAFVGNARMRTLNRTWRGIDRATDVLAFPQEPSKEIGSGPWTFGVGKTALANAASAKAQRPRTNVQRPAAKAERSAPKAQRPIPNVHLGDIVIATGVAARQARDAGHAAAVEWRVLALHGLLHLLGHDHDRDDGTMARVEARLRRKGGLTAGLIERAPRGTHGERRA